VAVETSFGRWLKRRRKALDLTQEELAQRVGCAAETLRKIEADVRRPSRQTAERLAEALEIPAADRAVFIRAARAELAVDRLTSPIHDIPQVALVPAKVLSSAAVSFQFTQISATFQPKPFDGRCPYKGLDAFEEDDAELFFGRDKIVKELVGRVQESRAVFIIGPSGSGKSSLVRAGLLHALKQGAVEELNSERWLYETMSPGRDPIAELARIISSMAGTTNAGEEVRAKAWEDESIFNQWCEIALKEGRDRRAVLFLDQFEEVFTQIRSEEERLIFLNLLTCAVTAERGRVIVLFAMRSDFVLNCATYPQLNSLFNQQAIQIGAMQPEELVSAIAQPALRVGLHIDPDLVAQIVNDMQGESGALPLMQFALKDLFDTQQAKGGIIALTLKDYLQHGGIRKSLERYADHSFAQLSEREQELARTIFSGLIEIGRGTQGTRRTAFFDELVVGETKQEDVEAIVQKLADARLITTDEQAGKDIVTISHEKLIDAWPWLKKLVNENRDIIGLQNEIATDAKEWEEHDRDASYLYRGARLATAREQLEVKKLVLSGAARQFIAAGTRAFVDELEASKQRATQLRRRSIYLSLAFGAALIAMGVAVFFSVQTRQQAKLAISRELAAASIGNLNIDPELSILLALHGLSTKYSSAAENALRHSLAASSVKSTLRSEAYVYSLVFSPDGKHVATAEANGVVQIWDVQTGQEVLRFGATTPKVAIFYKPSGNQLITADTAGYIKIWNAKTGKEDFSLFTFAVEIATGAMTADGSLLATASYNIVQTWDVSTGKELFTFSHTNNVKSLAFSRDGTRLAATGSEGDVIIWNTATGQDLLTFKCGQDCFDSNIIFNTDGTRVVISDSSGFVRFWDITGSQAREVFYRKVRAGNYPVPINLGPDGTKLAVAQINSVSIWDASTGLDLFVLPYESLVSGVDFSPDGKLFAAGGRDGTTIKIWDLSLPGEKLILDAYEGNGIEDVAFSPDGTRMVTINVDRGDAHIWDAITGHKLLTIHESDVCCSAVFSLDGTRLLTGSSGGKVKIWDASTGKRVTTLSGHLYNIVRAIFSQDGTRVATASRDGRAIIWDASSGKQLVAILVRRGWVNFVAFSPDGKLLATSSTDSAEQNGELTIWDAETGKFLFSLSVPNNTAICLGLTFSSDGKRLAVGYDDNVARIWDISTMQPQTTPVLVLRGHSDTVWRVAFSPDRTRLATASFDTTIKLWDVSLGPAQGEELATFPGHTGEVKGIAFSPDGKYLASGSGDGTLRVYFLRLEDLIAYAKSRLTRTLTQEECQRYLHREVCPAQ